MRDQERLNSIKQRHEKAIQRPIITATVHPYDANWLIQQVEEKIKLEKQIERYKRTLEDALWSLKTFETEDAQEAIEGALRGDADDE